MNAPKATRVIRHPSGAETRVPSQLIAPERDRPTLAELTRAPVGFLAKVWGR